MFWGSQLTFVLLFSGAATLAGVVTGILDFDTIMMKPVRERRQEAYDRLAQGVATTAAKLEALRESIAGVPQKWPPNPGTEMLGEELSVISLACDVSPNLTFASYLYIVYKAKPLLNGISGGPEKKIETTVAEVVEDGRKLRNEIERESRRMTSSWMIFRGFVVDAIDFFPIFRVQDSWRAVQRHPDAAEFRRFCHP